MDKPIETEDGDAAHLNRKLNKLLNKTRLQDSECDLRSRAAGFESRAHLRFSVRHAPAGYDRQG